MAENETLAQHEGATDEIQEAKAEASTAVSEAKSEIASSLHSTSETVKQEVAHLAQDLTASAASAAAGVGHAVKEQASSKAGQVAGEAKAVAADKIHGAADTIRQRSTLPQAQAIDGVASKLDAAANYVQEHDYSEIKSDFEQSVRRQPMLAVAIAFVGGYLLGSLLKRG